MTYMTLILLSLSLLALYHSTNTAEAKQVGPLTSHLYQPRSLKSKMHRRSAEALSGLSARRAALATILRRRRSLEASLRAPPRFSSDFLIPGLEKREDEWIWMPAHGYIPMPKEEVGGAGSDHDNGIGNLLRYG